MTNKIKTVLSVLNRQFPNPGAMELGDPYRTIVGVVLSARTRDEQVLKLLPEFFRSFPFFARLAQASVKEVNAKIATIGMHRQKAKNLVALAQSIERDFEGMVPGKMDDLVSLAGVGRKTASVVLASCFGQPAIAVDTHVHRVTNRLGWVKTKTPEKTEVALLKIVPTNLMRLVNQVFVKFGRYICIPGRPRCWMCPIQKQCAFKNKNLVPPKDAEVIRADIVRREDSLEQLRQSVYGKLGS